MKDGFKSLIVWQKAMALAREMYHLTAKLPSSEQFGLSSQLRRSAVSIPSNIAEGSRRGTKNDYVQFLRISHGSLSELETQLMLVAEIYPRIDTTSALRDADEIGRMLYTLIQKLKS
jgi:carbamoyl-phosphate synthase large subunit